ncbi:MAG: NAD(P)H-hydrate dehydratase, partial [Prolixibacteraceae bacterium]|nr:NAD(P)H-hydrate dehydratase [Prolixibacteraceae bacterium]
MKLFVTKQIAEIDKYTIENEPIADIDLMERAALQITNWMIKRFSAGHKMIFFAGPGNNGGDTLSIARQMADLDYQCEVYLLDLGKELKVSPSVNWTRLEEQNKVRLSKIKQPGDFPLTTSSDIFIDGLFGTGLTRPLEGFPASVIKIINSLPNLVVSVDIPSGLSGDDNSANIYDNIVKADFTLTFQFPKISFLYAESEQFTGKWEVLPIGLHKGGIAKMHSDIFFTDREDIIKIVTPRSKFSHKGTFGHALLVSGSFGKMGAAILASRACLRSGAGLLTTHIPGKGYVIIQTGVPEAMASIDNNDLIFTEVTDLSPFSAIGIGPGLGCREESKKGLHDLIKRAKVPLVIDADALNILSQKLSWLNELQKGAVLTPHPGEFERLAGRSASSYERIQKQRELAGEFNVVVVLKGAYTSIATPGGKLFFNSTGNPGMATAGSGDVLT